MEIILVRNLQKLLSPPARCTDSQRTLKERFIRYPTIRVRIRKEEN